MYASYDSYGKELLENFFESALSGGGTGGSTIVRVDRVAFYDGETLLWESAMVDRQDYSTDGPMEYFISNVHADDIANVKLTVYLTLMNENYAAGPLYLMDTFRFVRHYQDDRFQLDKNETKQHPADYPSLP